MRQRITYVQPEGTGIDPNAIHVNPDSLVFSNSHNAALEKRVTVGLKELPEEVTAVLSDCHELHIRWAAPDRYDLPSPLLSRLPPGLHVFYTPLKADQEADLCPLLRTLFGEDLKCDSVKDSFSRPPILSERFSSASSYQYHQVLPHLTTLSTYLSTQFCPSNLKIQLSCETEAEALEYAASVDIDFDTISHAVSLTATWSPDAGAGQRPGQGITSRAIVKLREHDTIEVGVLQGDKADEIEELSLGGYLAVIGEQEHPSATLFSFPSRHHPSPQTFHPSFPPPPSLHPSLSLSFPTPLPPPQPNCALQAYLTLPPPLFLDRYAFSDALFLASNNLRALPSLSGATDLEAPAWAVRTWGSTALFELASPDPSTPESAEGDWMVTIPTHLRYVAASNTSTTSSDGSYADVSIPAPALFWACPADSSLKFRTNPFDRTNLGYDGLFGDGTMFYHLSPSSSSEISGDGKAGGHGELMLNLHVPVLDPQAAGWVTPATAVVVVVGFAWMVWKLLAAAGIGGKSDGGEVAKGGEKKAQ